MGERSPRKSMKLQRSFTHTSSVYVRLHVCIAFLLKGEPAPECIRCQSSLTIKHILLNCVDFMVLRQQFYTANSMHEFFTKVKQENILVFLSAAGLYRLT